MSLSPSLREAATRQAALTAGESGASKFPYVAEQLRLRMASGEWAPGDRLPTFAELREEFGVTPGTVSRALGQLEQEGLLNREKGRGVFVAEPALRARQHAIGCFDFAMDIARSPYWIRLMAGIYGVTRRDQLALTLFPDHNLRGLERVDGVLIHGEKGPLPNFPRSLPVVGMMESAPGLTAVVADDFGSVRTATRYLRDLGHSKIGWLAFLKTSIIQLRLSGYRYSVTDTGLEFEPSLLRDIENENFDSVTEKSQRSMRDWLADDSPNGFLPQRITAVFCQSDDGARGAIQALREHGLRVPEDVSVIGFDGMEQEAGHALTLTTLEVPIQQVGRRAIDLLVKQIQFGCAEPERIVLPTPLRVGLSTGPPPAK